MTGRRGAPRRARPGRGRRQVGRRDEPARARRPVEAATPWSGRVVFGDGPAARSRHRAGASFRSTIWPARWRNAIASPAGDQTGENEWRVVGDAEDLLAPVSSRITTSVPNEFVFGSPRRTGRPASTTGRGSPDRSAPRVFFVARVVAVDLRGAPRAVAAVPDVEQDLAVRPPRRVLVAERAGLRQVQRASASSVAMSKRLRTTSLWSGFGPSVTTMTALAVRAWASARASSRTTVDAAGLVPAGQQPLRPVPSGFTRISAGVVEVVPGPRPPPSGGNLPRPSSIRMK